MSTIKGLLRSGVDIKWPIVFVLFNCFVLHGQLGERKTKLSVVRSVNKCWDLKEEVTGTVDELVL